jgi:hypothetical protein
MHMVHWVKGRIKINMQNGGLGLVPDPRRPRSRESKALLPERDCRKIHSLEIIDLRSRIHLKLSFLFPHEKNSRAGGWEFLIIAKVGQMLMLGVLLIL